MLEEKVKKIIEEIRPYLKRDGGDIEFKGIEGKKVKVSLKGACQGCPGATMTLKMGVEKYIREKLPEIEGVINV
ncbi:MAG TPA: NifU family protein [Spirochaetota bacterium]|nr:NifU family protein [Spirochaetota bacterium]HOM38300.1 NifU family protein [Spirochaetota bacterium]HPQ48482.1 NifU family protein [Spirochaetota bacterium]